jgi:hypothetical protein
MKYLSILSCKKNSDINDVIISPSNSQNAPALFQVTNHIVSGITIPDLDNSSIQTAVNGSISGTILFSKNNNLNLVIPPTLFFNYPLVPVLHLIKNGNSWKFKSSYPDDAMGAARNYDCIDSINQTWVYSDHGLELRVGSWPYGHIKLMKTKDDNLIFSNISTSKSFYHSVSTGDLNGDGLKDVIGLHMGTSGNWYDNLHTFTQNKDGSFSENRNILNSNIAGTSRGAGAVLIKNLFGDSSPEVVKADYGFNSSYQKPSDRYSFMIYTYDSYLSKYVLSKDPGPLGVYSNNDRGTTSIKAADFNKDGSLDLALATEGKNYNGIEIWFSDGKGNFLPSNNKLEYSFDQLQFREFEVYDYDNDGYPDIFLNPWAGKLFKMTQNTVNMDNLLWKNNSGNFTTINKGIIVTGITSTFMKVFYINNQILYIGIEGNPNGGIIINEIIPKY